MPQILSKKAKIIKKKTAKGGRRNILIKNPSEEKLIRQLEKRNDIKAKRIIRLLKLPAI